MLQPPNEWVSELIFPQEIDGRNGPLPRDPSSEALTFDIYECLQQEDPAKPTVS